MNKLIQNLLKIKSLINHKATDDTHQRIEVLEKRIQENKRRKNEVMYGSNMLDDQSWSNIERKGDIYNTVLSDQRATSQMRQNSRAMREGSRDRLVNRESTGSSAANETREGIHSRRWQGSDPRHSTWTRQPDLDNMSEDQPLATNEFFRENRPGHKGYIQLKHDSNLIEDIRNPAITWKKPRLQTSGIGEARADSADSSARPLNVKSYSDKKLATIRPELN